MRRGLRPEAWVLIICGSVGVLVGADALVRTLRGAPRAVEPPAQNAQRDAAMAGSRSGEIAVKTGLSKDTLAPDFELPEQSGRRRKLSDFAGKPTLLAFYCGCARCGMMAQMIYEIETSMGPKQPQNVAVVTMDPASLDTWARNSRFRGTMLLEAKKGPVMAQYSGHPCPRVYLLGPDQRIRYVTPSPENPQSPEQILDPLAAAMGSSWRFAQFDALKPVDQ